MGILLAALMAVGSWQGGYCTGSGETMTCWDAAVAPVGQKPPIDVPAIKICAVNVKPNEVCPFPDDFPKHTGYRYTCADKSRILQTAENGTKWCHKVQN